MVMGLGKQRSTECRRQAAERILGKASSVKVPVERFDRICFVSADLLLTGP